MNKKLRSTNRNSTFQLMLLSCGLICSVVGPALAESKTSNCPTNDIFPEVMFPEVTFETTMGNIVIELDRQKAPATVNHFLYHLDKKAMDDTLVHRVVKDYVIQTAAFKSDASDVKSCGTVMNESGNGLKNNKGTVAMARFDDPHSASTSFYFNMQDNNNLDPNPKGWGYTVFGLVIEGMDVLEKINQEPVEYNKKLNAPNVPVVPVIIKKVSLNYE